MALKLYDKLTPSGDFPLVSATDVEMSDGSRLSEFSPGIDENTAERIAALEEQDKVFMQAAEMALGKVSALEERIESLEENPSSGIDSDTEERISDLEAQADSAAANWLNNSLRLNALETPAASVDLTSFDATGVITETYTNGNTSVYTLTFDENGNPTKIVETRKNGDGQVVVEYTTVLTW